MAYDENLVERLEVILDPHPFLSRKKMFGGIVWMLRGHMCIAAFDEFLVIRVGHEACEALCKQDHINPMNLSGRQMKGWAMIHPDYILDESMLEEYADLALAFVNGLKPKQ